MGELSRDVMLYKRANRQEVEQLMCLVRQASFPEPFDLVRNYVDGHILFGHQDGLYWETPSPRAIITVETRRIPKTTETRYRRSGLEFRSDVDFDVIVNSCRRSEGTWITDDIIRLYRVLNADGWVFTLGAYRDGNLVAGMWGLEIGKCLGVMSMFHNEPHSGAICIAYLLESLSESGRFSSVDFGYQNAFFERHGSKSHTTDEFRRLILSALKGCGGPFGASK